MPTSIKTLENLAPNSVEKREETWKQGRCQKCLAKVPVAKQFKVTNDLDTGKVKVGKADETHSHYCGDCKDVRVQMKESWLANRDGEGAKKAPKKTAKKAAAKKGGKSVAKKAPAKKAAKGKKAASAASTDEPF